MADGIVTVGGNTVGKFDIELDDRIIVQFTNGAGVKAMLEYARNNKMPVQLHMSPPIEEH